MSNIIRLTEEYLHSLCSVKNIAGELLVTGRLSVLEPDYLEIQDPDNRLPLVPDNMIVHISMTTEGLPPYFGVGRACNSTVSCLRIANYADINHFERRGAFRVPVKLKGKLCLLDEGGGADRKSETPVRVRDISLSGIFFKCKRELSVGQRVQVTFMIPRDYFQFTCQVRRSVSLESEMGYGCSFEGMSKAMSDKLCAYLFRVQGEQLRKSSGREVPQS